MKSKVKRQGDWKCVVCTTTNFAFRNNCNRCQLISKQQNDHQMRMWAYGQQQLFITPVRKKDHIDQDKNSAVAKQSHQKEGLLSLSPVLRQLGI